jgi:hypothetical protein
VSADSEEGGKMMNQVRNLIQWKNLTQEQKDDFNFENYEYQFLSEYEWTNSTVIRGESAGYDLVYRLVIEDDKYYVYEDGGREEVFKGDEPYLVDTKLLRPARPDEIPQPEKTLEQKIQEKWPDKEVIMFGWSSANIWGWTTGNKTEHIKAQSMRGFHTYVYQRPQDDSFFPDTEAIFCWNEFLTLQPVAALFERSEG